MQGNGVSTSQSPGVLANYTLPGVISYLTSEFTSLERFKIMTNLEKSEMKYRIQQLTSELNSVRFLNEKQALRIKLLEEKLENVAPGSAPVEGAVGADLVEELASSSSNEDVVSESLANLSLKSVDQILENGSGKQIVNGRSVNSTPEIAADSSSTSQIPHVDLEFLRNSRSTLNRSIREIVKLLEPPSGLDFSETPSGVEPRVDLADLLEDSKHFSFDTPIDPSENPKESMFARYTLSKDDLLSGQRISFEDDVKQAGDALGSGLRDEIGQVHDPSSNISSNAEQHLVDESDAETVTIDEPDLVGILDNGSEDRI